MNHLPFRPEISKNAREQKDVEVTDRKRQIETRAKKTTKQKKNVRR